MKYENWYYGFLEIRCLYKMKFAAIILVLFYFGSCANSNIRPDLQKHVNYVDQFKEIPNDDSALVSYFKDSCTKTELLNLLKSKSAIVKVIA